MRFVVLVKFIVMRMWVLLYISIIFFCCIMYEYIKGVHQRGRLKVSWGTRMKMSSPMILSVIQGTISLMQVF